LSTTYILNPNGNHPTIEKGSQEYSSLYDKQTIHYHAYDIMIV